MDHYSNFSKEYILPKGVVEIIFNFSDGAPILAQLQNTVQQLPHCFINGFNTTPVQIRLPRQQVFFGVVLQPLSIKKIFGCPAGEFADTTVELPLIDKSLNALWHQLAEKDNFDTRVAVFLNWISRKCIDWLPQEQLINNFLYAAHQHELSVQQLAHIICYSPRHLSRKIEEATGMNTEEILLYKKFQHAVQLIHHTNLPMTAIAYQSQFSDQSHFIRTFKTYSKMTPGAYKRNKSAVQGHLYEDVR
ncbi:hypothetical protein GCM10027043_09560 [Ferruginibacter profundus]